VGCYRGGCILRSGSRYVGEVNQVRRVGPVDGVDGVIYRRVHDREAACRVHGCGLRAGGANNHEKGSIPLQDLVDRLGGGVVRSPITLVKRGPVRLADLERCQQPEQ
jgi:hypothetical protein